MFTDTIANRIRKAKNKSARLRAASAEIQAQCKVMLELVRETDAQMELALASLLERRCSAGGRRARELPSVVS
jgi:hypothetical protein